jgi:hypothetical protein
MNEEDSAMAEASSQRINRNQHDETVAPLQQKKQISN